MEGGSATAASAGRPGWPVALVHAGALGLAGFVFVQTADWSRWDIGLLVPIALFAIGSDLASVQTGSNRLKISGADLATVLVAVRLGPAPAALVGALTIAVGWIRLREAPHYLRNNLVTYVWFPLASALFFHAATRLFGISERDVAYYVLVIPAFAIAISVNFWGVASYQCYLDGSSLLQKTREVLVPVLSAELFSAVLTVAAVFFVVKTGVAGVLLLAVTLAIFQYLVGELLTSQRRGEELQRKATTDELTGLANRQQFRSAVQDQIDASSASGDPFAVMLLDLDRFKEINDTLGHHYGDVLLGDLAERLGSSLRSQGVVARLGGDEFAVLLTKHGDDPDALGEVADELIACIEQPLVVDQLTLEVGASVGISRYPLDGDDVYALLRRADVAMYAAKEQHSSYRLYEAGLDHHSVRRLTVLSDFRRALDSDEFVVHYQPIVEVEGSRPLEAEALVRWQHPDLGLLSPGQFVPIAEQSGLIGRLTQHVLERSIAECAAWRMAGISLVVSVNLSARDLLDRDLPRRVESLLDGSALAPEALRLEITESMIMSDPERSSATVMALRNLGVQVAIDDFGTGYSSLANLKSLPISALKIDRSFVGSLLSDESDLIIVRSTINLGHDLGLMVIAEGVEDELTLARLATFGCELAQGYHISRPLPPDAFARWVNAAGLPAAAAAAAAAG